MPMDGQRRAGFQRVEHPLRLIVRPVAQVKIHPKPRRGLCLRGEIVEELLGDEHNSVFVLGKRLTPGFCRLSAGIAGQPEIRRARCPRF